MNISPDRQTTPEMALANCGGYELKNPVASQKHFHNFKLLKSGLDIAPLANALAENPELWDEITARQDTPGSPHHYTHSIFIRWAATQTVEAAFTEIPATNYPALWALPEVQPLVEEVMLKVGATELGRVMLVSLEPGGFIAPHNDEGAYADHYERFHIALQSDEGNVFNVESSPGCGEFVHMQPGEMWFFNHKATHFLFNGSDRPRVHLIVDCVAPKYRMDRE